MADDVKSRAVVRYTGMGRSPFPRADPDAVLGAGTSDSEELVRYVQGLVCEIFELFSLGWRGDQGNLDLGQAMELVEMAMLKRHPELDLEAAHALAWMWGYSAWK